MHFKKLIIVVVLLTLISLLGNIPIDYVRNSPADEEKAWSNTEEERLTVLRKLSEDLHHTYEGFTVGMNSNHEVVIQIEGDQEYVNSLEREMNTIVKKAIHSSAFQNYSVVVKRIDPSYITDEVKNIHNELSLLSSSLLEGLKEEFDVIGDINIDDQQLIIIQTSLEKSKDDAHKLARTIEDAAKIILASAPDSSLSPENPFEIKVIDSKNEILN
ncbi:hypothetical protein [Jeotgalibacillus proteolyticus]|uniref:DUF4030 domain-containing protein n=1 Tax=Jeotgalibacillus proteolyticus TaxID=2082395 RepID=A0A2S5G790_9BACL|nr:hypothetical protein [Jeotgalibacillus proteolyticus]PPA68849.1 hypothetical protein C4B60_18190 [Jeotgalibacillus proteolyticus]